MSTATINQLVQDLAGWIATVQRGEVVAILDAGHEVARLMPPERKTGVDSSKEQPVRGMWSDRMAELEAIFPEPVTGVSDALEEFRADRF
jgi:antitoxin (DNA-binding transcriptional repressor) of toxin-antitoxin stability system